jgi:hypothetical protein
LFHLSLEKRNGNEYTLNTIIDELYSIIGDNKLHSNILNRKLISVGYFKHHEAKYDETSYLIRGEDFYLVSGNFPRIEEKDLVKGVGDVHYSVVLTSETEKHKSDFQSVIKKFGL